MKKVFIVTGIVVVILLGSLLLIPVLFKDSLLRTVKNTISQNLKVNVDFDNFNLSLIRNFPKATLSLSNILVTGQKDFSRDTLLQMGSLQTKFGIFDLFSPNNLTINELILNKPRLNLLVNQSNRANWDIVPESSEAGSSEKSTFALALNKIELNQASVSYLDQTVPLALDLSDIHMVSKGQMYGSETELKLSGKTESFTLIYDSVTYISKVRLDLNALLHINFDSWKYEFKESELLVNGLPVDVKGNFAIPGDSMFFDLAFKSKVSELGDFLKLVPPDYQNYLKDLKSSGKAELSGNFKGLYFEENYPALNLLFKVTGGKMHYTGFSEEIKNIAVDGALTKPQGRLNLTSLSFSNAHAEIRNNPVDFSLHLDNLFEDMHFRGKLVGKVNFDELKDAVPMNTMQLSGLMNVNIGMDGNMSAIENKNYELLKTDGMLALSNFIFSTDQLTMPVMIPSGNLDFAPEKINLQRLEMKIGKSDMLISGFVTDYYAWLLTGGVLTGDVTMNSDYLNLNELMQLQKSDSLANSPKGKSGELSEGSSGALESSTFTVPEKVQLTLQTNVGKALYDQLNITNIKGRVLVNNGRLDINGLTMNLLDGEMKMTGNYRNTHENSPMVNLSLELTGFDIPKAFQSLKLIRNYIPIAAQSKGRFSTNIRIEGRLDSNNDLLMEKLNGNGVFNTHSVQVVNSPVFNKIKSVLKEDKLSDMRIDDFTAIFTIENGNLLLKPFKTRIAEQEATFRGQLNTNNILELNIGFIISRDALSENIENTLAILPGQQNIGKIPVNVQVSGPVKEPDVKIDLSEARKAVSKEVKNASREEIKKTINKVGEGIKKLFK